MKNLIKINPYNFVIAISGIMLLVIVSVMFGYAFTNKGLVIASAKQEVDNFYLVEIAREQDFEKAQELANSAMQKGGAGYIYYDEGFRVFVAGYLTKTDAQAVADKNAGASVYELRLSKFDFDNGFSKKVNLVLKNNILSFQNCISSLNDLILDYQQGKINETELKSYCLLLKEEVEMQVEKFEEVFYQSNEMYKYKNYILTFKEDFDKIINLDCEKLDFTKAINYQQISCMFGLKRLLDIC